MGGHWHLSPLILFLLLINLVVWGGIVRDRDESGKKFGENICGSDEFSAGSGWTGLFHFTTTLDQSLSNNFISVKTKIDSLVSNRGNATGKATYTGIKNVANQWEDQDAVKAIILVTDGEWNYDGTPLGKGYRF